MSNCTSVNIFPNNFEVVVVDNSNTITIVNNNCTTQVNVTQEQTQVVQVYTGHPGGVGPVGPIGPSGSTQPFSYVTGSTWNTTSSIEITGSFTVSGSNTFKNIGPAIFSGSVNISSSTIIDGYIDLLNQNNIPSSSNGRMYYKSGSDGFVLYSQDPSNNEYHTQFKNSSSAFGVYLANAGGTPIQIGSTTNGAFGLNVNGGNPKIRIATNGNVAINSTLDHVVPFNVNGNTNITGSLLVTGGITGSLRGTASYANQALTASYLSGSVSVFPYTGSAIISGSLIITGSIRSLVTGSDFVNIGNATTSSQRLVRIGQDTAFIDIGSYATGTSNWAFYANQTTPGSTNYFLMGSNVATNLNGSSAVNIQIGTSNAAVFNNFAEVTFSSINRAASLGTAFTIKSPTSTNQTAGSEIPNFIISGSNKTWLTGNIPTQRWNYITANTASFVSSSVITQSFGLFVESAISSSTSIIVNNHAIGTSGSVLISNPNTAANIILRDWVSANSLAAIYFGTSPAADNYFVIGDGNDNYVNGKTSLNLRVASATKINLTSTATTFTQNAASSGAVTNFTFSPSTNTGQTAGSNIPNFVISGSNKQWLAGNISNQYFNHFTGNTASFTGTSTITDVANLYVEKPVLGTNAIFTRTWSILANGDIGTTDGRLISVSSGNQGIALDRSATVNHRFKIFVGDGTGGFNADENYLRSANTSLHFLLGPSGLNEVAEFSFDGRIAFSPVAYSAGTMIPFLVTIPSHTGQTATVNIPSFKVSGSNKTWNAGNISNQYWNYFSANTASFNSSSLINNSYGLFVEAAAMGTAATASNNWAIGSNGNLQVQGNIYTTNGCVINSDLATIPFGNRNFIFIPNTTETINVNRRASSTPCLSLGSDASSNATFNVSNADYIFSISGVEKLRLSTTNSLIFTGSLNITGSFSINNTGSGTTGTGSLVFSERPTLNTITHNGQATFNSFVQVGSTLFANLSGNWIIQNTAAAGNVLIQSRSSSGNFFNFMFHNKGFFGINQLSPSMSLDVSGSGRFTNGLEVTGSILTSGSSILTGSLLITGSSTINGTLTVSNGNVFISPSFSYILLAGSDSSSRRWKFRNDVTAFGDFKLLRSIDNTSDAATDVLSFDSLGNATLSGSLNIQTTGLRVTGSAIITGSQTITGSINLLMDTAIGKFQSRVGGTGNFAIYNVASPDANNWSFSSDGSSATILNSPTSVLFRIGNNDKVTLTTNRFQSIIPVSITSSTNISGSLVMSPSSSFELPLTASVFVPGTGSIYFSGSFLFVWNGTRYMSASLA